MFLPSYCFKMSSLVLCLPRRAAYIFKFGYFVRTNSMYSPFTVNCNGGRLASTSISVLDDNSVPLKPFAPPQHFRETLERIESLYGHYDDMTEAQWMELRKLAVGEKISFNRVFDSTFLHQCAVSMDVDYLNLGFVFVQKYIVPTDSWNVGVLSELVNLLSAAYQLSDRQIGLGGEPIKFDFSECDTLLKCTLSQLDQLNTMPLLALPLKCSLLSFTSKWKCAILITDDANFPSFKRADCVGFIAAAAFRNCNFESGIHFMKMLFPVNARSLITDATLYSCLAYLCGRVTDADRKECDTQFRTVFELFKSADYTFKNVDLHVILDRLLVSMGFKTVNTNSDYTRFLDVEAPFDVVIDGLNVFYNRVPKSKQYTNGFSAIEAVISEVHRRSENAKILIICRRHLVFNKFMQSIIKSNTLAFPVDDLTHDDCFVVLAALRSGAGCKVISHDLFRNVEQYLSSHHLTSAFRRWRQCSLVQYQLTQTTARKMNADVRSLFPLKRRVIGDLTNNVHIPIVRLGESEIKPVHDGLTALTWICARK